MKNKSLDFMVSLIFGMILALFIVLTSAYSLNIIYLIGDPRQLEPLFEGLIAGSFIFSILGMLMKRKFMYAEITISAIMILLAGLIIYLNDMVIDNFDFFYLALLVSSPLLPISGFFGKYNRWGRRMIMAYPLLLALLFLLAILVFSIFYERSGQSILPLGISIFAYLSIAISIIFIVLKKKG